MEKEKPEEINEELLNHVAGGVAGGISDNAGPSDALKAEILRVVGENRDDMHADSEPKSVEQRSLDKFLGH